MKRIVLAIAGLALAGCSSMPSLPTIGGGGPSAFAEESMTGGRYRIAYTAPDEKTGKQMVSDRVMVRASQVTLEKGQQWFEIASKVEGKLAGKATQTLIIQMGKGETLAGGPKQYDARQTLASLQGKIS